MFRKMRLEKDNQIPSEQAVELLKACTYGTLAVEGDDSYPYAVPVNYVYKDNKLYFHGAPEGQKLDGIKKNEKVSFCVVSKADILPEAFNCLFLSTIAFGKARVISDNAEKKAALGLFLDKYSANFIDKGNDYIKAAFDDVCVIEMSIEHLTGKKGV